MRLSTHAIKTRHGKLRIVVFIILNIKTLPDISVYIRFGKAYMKKRICQGIFYFFYFFTFFYFSSFFLNCSEVFMDMDWL